MYILGEATGKKLFQDLHRLKKYLNIEGFLEKPMKIKSALKRTAKLLSIRP